MPYGIIKIDTITFTDAGVDKSVSVSGLVQNPTFTGNVTATGTISGLIVQAPTVTGTTANFASGVYTTQISGAIVKVPAGTAGAPSIQVGVGASVAPGLYGAGTDLLGISTGGAGRIFIDSTGRLGVGTSNPTEFLEISATTDPKIHFIDVGNTTAKIGIVGSTALGFEIAGSERLRIDSSGRVGVGTSSLSLVYRTTINGDGSSIVGGLSLQNNGVETLTIGTVTAANNVDSEIWNPRNGYLRFATNNTERLRIDSSGNVGIGTTTAGARLQVNAPTTSRVYTSSVLDFSNIHLEGITASTTTSALTFSSGNGGGAAVAFSRDNAFGTFIGFWTNSAASANAATERLRIDNSGRVGIGTSSPGYKLEVFGTSNANEIRSSDGTTIGQWYQDSGGISIFGTVSNHPLAFRTNSSERMRIDSSGRLLVGTSTSINNLLDAAVQIAGTSTDSYLSVTRFSSVAGDPAGIILGRSKSATKGVNTAVSNGDYLGAISFSGANGTSYTQAASIGAEVDGAVTGGGAGDMPGRLVFSTTADGASSPTERMRIESNGNARFSNLATIYPTTDNAVTNGGSGFRWSAIWAANGTIQTSDERAKTDVSDAELGFNFIKSLRPVSYKWVEGGKVDTGKRDDDGNYIYQSVPGERTHWGFIAQEVKEAVDDAGVDFGGWILTDKNDPNSQQALRYDQFIAPLTKALQEAIAKIETLEAKVAALEGN